MANNNSPQDWNMPLWHSDFGDPSLEFEALQSLALALSETEPGAKATLETPEPGLMDARIALPNGLVAEVHSVSVSQGSSRRRFAVFLSPDSEGETENYFDSIEQAVQFLTLQGRE